MENCPRLALEFGLRIGLELGFGAGGGQFSSGAIVLELASGRFPENFPGEKLLHG